MLSFAILGILMTRLRISVVCLVLGFLLGGMLENSLRQSLVLYAAHGSSAFYSPIAGIFILLTILTIVRAIFLSRKKG